MTWDEICKRAGGRRNYNGWRALTATLRRREVARLMFQHPGKGMTGRYGWQSAAAQVLGVSRATICRDAAILENQWRASHKCPLCGSLTVPMSHETAG